MNTPIIAEPKGLGAVVEVSYKSSYLPDTTIADRFVRVAVNTDYAWYLEDSTKHVVFWNRLCEWVPPHQLVSITVIQEGV